MVETHCIGVFVCHCELNMTGVVDVKEVIGYAPTLAYVVFSEDKRYSYANLCQKQTRHAIKENKQSRVDVATRGIPNLVRCVGIHQPLRKVKI